jgi:hypothetical protein
MAHGGRSAPRPILKPWDRGEETLYHDIVGKLRRAGAGGWRREGGGFRCQTCELVGCCGGADTEMDAVGTAI